MILLQIPEWIKKIWNRATWQITPNEQKTIYLTFDDGPHPSITPRVLEILDEFDAKATFFCVGENAMRFADVLPLIRQKGHTLGNHTYNHLKGFKTDDATYFQNIEKTDKWIKTRLFRPPYGQITPRQINKLSVNRKVIMWSFITYDYDARVLQQQIMKTIKKRSFDGAIVVFHDSEKAEKNMFSVLPQALQYWKNQGYQIKAIPER